MSIQFFSQPRVQGRQVGKGRVYLSDDRWNDWGEFQTQYWLSIFDESGKEWDLGPVKIGRTGQTQAEPRVPLSQQFDALPEGYFSLGQEPQYYEQLGKLPEEFRQAFVAAMRDLVADSALFDSVLREEVVTRSILRGVTVHAVRHQFRRLLAGGERNTEYRFGSRHTLTESTGGLGGDSVPPFELTFRVRPHTVPSTNLHALIGANGVGKTTILRDMWRALQPRSFASSAGVGTRRRSWFFTPNTPEGHPPVDHLETDASRFSSAVAISFSALDPEAFVAPATEWFAGDPKCHVVSLYNATDSDERFGGAKSPEDLAEEFGTALDVINALPTRRYTWETVLKMLSAQSAFAEMVELLVDRQDATRKHVLATLSAGHRIVLISAARLVELCSERTLVLIDEPESHLHPPLLSAFISALTEVLAQTNSVGIVATHSPVVLQELPASCVWVLRSSGMLRTASRPERETYGENIGTLTRDVFGLETMSTGFHRQLLEIARESTSFDDALSRLDTTRRIAASGTGLGTDGLALLRGYFVRRSLGEDADDRA